MLIINADDLGRSTIATDRAIACFAAKRITSASAMVYMTDSRRASEASHDASLKAGLHLNLSEPFSADDVPFDLLQAHEAIRSFVNANKYALVVFNPLLVREFEYVVQAQLNEFVRLFGYPPTHIDGHQHMHLATNVLLQGLLPAGVKVRRSFSFRPGERSLVNRGYRMGVDWLLQRRHPVADYFFSLSHHLSAQELDRVVAIAINANVELMAHPERMGEFEFLMGDSYLAAISKIDVGGYDALEP